MIRVGFALDLQVNLVTGLTPLAKKKVKTKPQSPASSESGAAEPCFEEALAELEQIVARLEGGQLGLEDALAEYELGVKRLKHCYRQLNDAERRIELVARAEASGEVQSAPFDDESSADLAAKGAARSQRRTAAPSPKRGSVDEGGTLF